MDPINKSLLNNVKNNQYFIDSRNWHLRNFIYPIIERSFLFLISIICMIILFIMVNNIMSLFPTEEKLYIPIYIDNGLTDIPVIKNIANANLSAEESIKEYLIKKYVINRESYDFSKIDKQLNFVKSNSVKSIYKKFSNYINIDNPDSPLLYQDKISKTVDINSVSLNKDNSSIVKFTINDINKDNNESYKTNYTAYIYYQMNNIENLLANMDNSSIDFIITDYKIEQIK